MGSTGRIAFVPGGRGIRRYGFGLRPSLKFALGDLLKNDAVTQRAGRCAFSECSKRPKGCRNWLSRGLVFIPHRHAHVRQVTVSARACELQTGDSNHQGSARLIYKVMILLMNIKFSRKTDRTSKRVLGSKSTHRLAPISGLPHFLGLWVRIGDPLSAAGGTRSQACLRQSTEQWGPGES